MKYLEYMKYSYLILLCMVLMSFKSQNIKEEDPIFSFGVIADCQYKGEGDTDTRKYSKSSTKLKESVEFFNSQDLFFTIHLGDLIDSDWESFDIVKPIFNKLKSTSYQVLGNHDFSVSNDKKGEAYRKMDMPSEYYDFSVEKWRFIVLNGNDISFYAYPEGSEMYNFSSNYYEQNEIKSPTWNGAIGQKQMNWLNETLKEASERDEKVIIFNHFPVYPKKSHNLWNDSEVIEIIERYPCVKAYMNGHNHNGSYEIKNGKHYLTFKGMVETEQNSYAIVEVYHNRIEIKGYGREESRTLPMF